MIILRVFNIFVFCSFTCGRFCSIIVIGFFILARVALVDLLSDVLHFLTPEAIRWRCSWRCSSLTLENSLRSPFGSVKILWSLVISRLPVLCRLRNRKSMASVQHLTIIDHGLDWQCRGLARWSCIWSGDDASSTILGTRGGLSLMRHACSKAGYSGCGRLRRKTK